MYTKIYRPRTQEKSVYNNKDIVERRINSFHSNV